MGKMPPWQGERHSAALSRNGGGRMRASELRPTVKSGLMIGAAGAAVTFGASGALGDSSSTQPPPSIHKYLPYTQIGGTSGDSMSTGDVTLFIPAWQALNQLLFIKVGGDLASGEGNFSTFGVGYRQKIAPRWIIGAFGNYDHTHTKLNDDFTQFVFGAELLNPDWEFHGNAYVADTSKIDLIKNSAQLEVDGNDIAIVREQEAPYSGFDGSGGYRAFKTPGTDGRLYAGGFYFKPSEDFDTKAIAGPKAGFEFNVYDLDFIGPQSRLQIQGEGRHDDVRGYTGFVGINLRVPLNIDPSGGGAQTLDELDRRMVDDPQTQGNVLTHSEFNKPEPVIIYGGSGGRTHPTNTIFYVDNSTGAGSYPNPTTFSDATTRGGDNALIVITTKEGDVSEPGVLAPGDMVIGAGTTLTIKGAETGYKFTHTFAPGEHDAVLSVPAGQTAITLAADNALYNFAIQGSFGTAIAGDNVGTATIRNLAITGDGSEGQKGIALTQDGTSALDLLMTDTSVSGVGSDGISLATHLDGAETHTSKIEFDNVSVSNVGGNGITFSTEASGGAAITQDITLNNVSVSGAGNIGIGIAGFAEGGGSQLTQTATITDANVTNVAGTGIAIYGYTSGGGALTQNVSIDPTIVSGSGYALGIGAYADGGTLNQTVNVDTLSGNGDNNGVEIYAYASGGATLNQTATLSNIGFDAVGHDGVRLFAHSYGGAYINQGVEFDGLTLNGAGLYDIAVEAYADGGAVKQTALFNNVTINGGAQTAVDIFAETGNGGEGSFRPLPSGGENGNYYSLIQDVVFNTAAIDTNGNGFYAGAKSSNGDSVAQYVSFSSDSAITAYDGGVMIYANASGNSLIHQQVHLPRVTLNGSIGGEGGEGGFEYAMGGGIRIETHSSGGSTVDSYTLIDSAGITYAADAAVSLAAYAQGGNIDQTLKLNDANISSYYATGISIYGDADGATLNQNAFFNNVTVNGSGDPFTATAKGFDGGTTNQYVSFTGDSALNSVDGSVSGTVVGGKYGVVNQTLLFSSIDVSGAEYGVALYAEADTGGTAHQGAALGNVTATGNSYGLYIYGSSNANGIATQTVMVDNLAAANNEVGIYLNGRASARLSQYVTVNGASLTGESQFGLYAKLAAQNGANALQSISLSDADTDNGGTGISAHLVTYSGGTGEQDFTLNNISAQYEANSGVAIYAGGEGTAIQRADINGLSASHEGADGISLSGNVNGGSIGQYIGVSNGTFSYDTNGIYAGLTGTNGTAHQQVGLTNVTADNNSSAGLYLKENTSGTSVYEYITATNSHFDHNGGSGISGYAFATGGKFSEFAVIAGSSADYNAGSGVALQVNSQFFNTSYQGVSAIYSDFSHNGADGVGVTRSGHYAYQGTQKFTGHDDTFNYNTHDGLELKTVAGTDVKLYQFVTSANDTFNANGYAGLSETAQNTFGPGFIVPPISAAQSLSSVGDTFSNNQVGGIQQTLRDQFGLYAAQYSTVSGATISGGQYGIYSNIYSGAAEGIIARSISNTTVTGTSKTGIDLRSSGAIDQDITSITDTAVTNAGNDGIHISAGGTYQKLTLANDTVAGAGVDGISISFNGGYQQLTLASDTVTNAGRNGIYDSITALGSKYGVASLAQNLTMTNDAVTDSGGAGVELYASSGPNSAILQHVSIGDLNSTGNAEGLSVYAKGFNLPPPYGSGSSVLGQYIRISNSHFDNNTGDGAYFHISTKYGATGLQSVSITNSSANGNGADGFHFAANASAAASAQQYAHLDGVSIRNNTGDGIDFQGTASTQGFAAQTLLVTNASDASNVISYNGGAGIGIVANAFNGGNVEQGIGIYNADISHNGRGISLSANAAGHVTGSAGTYYSHVTQNVNAYYDSFSHNGGNGVSISNVASGGAQINSFAYLKGDTIDYNAGDGVHVYSHAGAGSNVYDDIYMVGGSASHNAGNGIAINSYADQSTYLIQHIAVVGAAVNNNGGGESGGNGFVDNAHAQGQYSLNGQYITLAYSQFDGNNGAGAVFEAAQTYGPGTFGVARQYLTVVGSDFSHNARDGLYAITDASGNQGRAEQHFTISGSQFDDNAGNGIHLKNYVSNGVLTYGTNTDGTYPLTCNYVQGADGGCAFVRQTVDIDHSDVSHNGQDGIYISTVLNHYAAAYNVGGRPLYTPTLYLNSVTVDNNAGNGLHLTNLAGDHSYEYQYIVAVNSHFDHNAGDGILSGSGASSGSSIYQKILLASVGGEGGLLSTVDNNGRGGIDIEAGGSYANVISTALVLAYTDVSHNGGNGLEMHTRSTATGEALQSFGSVGSTFAHNSGDGVLLYSQSAGDGVAAQIAQSYGDTFTKNVGSGLSAQAIDYGVDINDTLYNSVAAAQSITSVGDSFNGNRNRGISEAANFDAPSIAYQNLYVSGGSFKADSGSASQLYASFQSGSSSGVVYRNVLDSSFAGGEGNAAINFYTTVMAGGFTVDLTTISNNTIRNAGQDGVKIFGVGANGGTLYQSITMDGDHVYGSGGDGVYVNATGAFGGKVIQDVAIDGLVSKGNGGDGLSLTAFSIFGGIAAQYVQLSNSHFLQNGGNGVAMLAEATGQFGGVASQQIAISNSQLLGNGNNGFYMGAHAGDGASIQQYALLSGIDASHNGDNGIRIAAYAQRQGFVAQGFVFDGDPNAPSSITHNGPTVYGGGDGVYISARAVFGGEIEQNSHIYNANISHNANDGIKYVAYANGSYPGVSGPYYSHISQNMAVGYGVIAHNGNDGVQIFNTADPGTGINQYLVFYNENISANAGKGIYEHSVAEAYLVEHDAIGTSLYSDIYVIGGNVTNNHTGGIDVRGYADGATYLIQNIVVQGVHVDGNHGDGISVIGSARGLYSLNIQYVTLAGSTFDHNTGDGAHISAHQFYGSYGSFGSARQYVTIQQSDLSHNGQNGLYGNALSTDEQGSAVQNFTIVNSTIDSNTGDGVHLSRTAGNGSYLDGYPCTSVQGVYGGCAFVRQTVQIAYSDISHNKGDGLYIGTNASNYGTVYSTGGRPKHTPTVTIYDSTLSHNGGDGMHLVNNVSGGSDVYQYVVAVDSHFDHNAGYGVEAANNVTGGSTLFQNIVLYHYVQPDIVQANSLAPMTVDNNGKGGVHTTTYAGAGSAAYQGLALIGADISHNTGDGVYVSMRAIGAAKAAQSVYMAYSDFVGNAGDGVHVGAYGLNGSKLSQTVTSKENYFAHNTGTGLYVGFTENGVKGATQHVMSYFDDFRQNGGGIGVNADFIGGMGKLSTGVLIGFDNLHGGKYGIDISLAASNGAHVSGFQKISYVGVENTKGDGIDLSLSGDTNAKWSNTAQIVGNGVQYAGGDGIAVNFTLDNGAHLGANPAYQSPGLLIQRNNVTGREPGGEGGLSPAAHGHDGIYVGFTVGNGASIYEVGGERGVRAFDAVIDNNTINYMRGDGIHVLTNNNGGTLDEFTSIYGNTVYAARGGIVVEHNQAAGRSNVGESIHGNHTYAYNFFGGERGGRYGNEAGIEVSVNGTGGTIFDDASIYSNLVQGHDIGIAVETHGDKGVNQFADIYGNQIYRNGTGVYGFAGGSSSQTIDYASNTNSSNGDTYYFNHGSGATQTLN
jgi:hypothetical protein